MRFWTLGAGGATASRENEKPKIPRGPEGRVIQLSSGENPLFYKEYPPLLGEAAPSVMLRLDFGCTLWFYQAATC